MTRASDDPRLDELVDLIVQLASGNLAARLADTSAARDSLDAVITGVNLLADELDRVHRLLQQGDCDNLDRESELDRGGALDRAGIAAGGSA